MKFRTAATFAIIYFAANAAAANAKGTSHTVAPMAVRQNPVASVRATLQLQGGQRPQSAPAFKAPQFGSGPHKPNGATSPAPLATPEYNPLKRRHLAMPGLPEPDLAF